MSVSSTGSTSSSPSSTSQSSSGNSASAAGRSGSSNSGNATGEAQNRTQASHDSYSASAELRNESPDSDATQTLTRGLTESFAEPPSAVQSAITREVQELPNGQTLTVERAVSPVGDFTGTYRSLSDEHGQEVERSYDSTRVTQDDAEIPGPHGTVATTINKEFDVEAVAQRQPDGSWETSYERSVTESWGDGQGLTSETVESSESDQVETTITYPDGRTRERVSARPEGGTAPDLSQGSPFSSEVQTRTLPDGSVERNTSFSDAVTGYQASEDLRSDLEGNPISRTRTQVGPAEEASGDLSGVSALEVFQHDSAQVLYDQQLGDGPITQRSGHTVTEQFGPDGQVIDRAEMATTTWTNQDATRELTRFDRGPEYADEYQLTKRDGDLVAIQNFVEGSPDTQTTREYVDDDGFRTVRVNSITPDGAQAAVDRGEVGLERSFSVSRMKEDATFADLHQALGPEYDHLRTTSPEFRSALETILRSSEPFSMVDMQSLMNVRNGEQLSSKSARALGLRVGDQTMTFGQNGETGEWSVQPSQGSNFQASGIGDALGYAGVANNAVQGTAGLVNGGQTPASLQRAGAGVDTALNSVSLVADTVDTLRAAYQGDWRSTLGYGASMARDIGELSPRFSEAAAFENLGLRTAAYAGRSLGVAGGAITAGVGAYDLVANGNRRGVFDMMAGAGPALGMLEVVGGATAGVVGGVGVLGGLSYDYVTGTDMADLRI